MREHGQEFVLLLVCFPQRNFGFIPGRNLIGKLPRPAGDTFVGSATLQYAASAWHRSCCVVTREVEPQYRLEEGAMTIEVNGSPVDVPSDARVSLLDLLRDRLQLFGTKKGCDQGACGACTVLADGERILSCLALAVQYDGRRITTIEGLGTNGGLHPLQAAFVEHDAFQCGYCTPGQICSAIGMLAELARGLPSAVTANLAEPSFELDADELRERMSGNLCRCGAYNGIVAAIGEFHGVEAARPTEVSRHPEVSR